MNSTTTACRVRVRGRARNERYPSFNLFQSMSPTVARPTAAMKAHPRPAPSVPPWHCAAATHSPGTAWAALVSVRGRQLASVPAAIPPYRNQVMKKNPAAPVRVRAPPSLGRRYRHLRLPRPAPWGRCRTHSNCQISMSTDFGNLLPSPDRHPGRRGRVRMGYSP